MYEDHSEIPIEDLAQLAEEDFTSKETGQYILCLRVNSESIYSRSIDLSLLHLIHS